jgi:predicted transcriptional regulator of viral defense system
MMMDEWLDFFKRNTDKKLFSLPDLIVLTGEKRSTTSVQLSRLVKSGILDRPVRGWYANPFMPPNGEEIAMVIRHPSYLSLEYALSRSGILSQHVFTYTLVTTKLPYTYKSEGDVFEYHQIKRSLFWGYKREGQILVAEPEKALLDLIHIRTARNGTKGLARIDALLDDIYVEELDNYKLLEYAERYGPIVGTYTRSLLDRRSP